MKIQKGRMASVFLFFAPTVSVSFFIQPPADPIFSQYPLNSVIGFSARRSFFCVG